MPDIVQNPHFQDRTDTPSRRYAAITTSDATNLTELTKALFIGVAGNVVVVGLDDVPVTFKNCQAGSILPVRAKRVNATNTTATDIVGLY